MKIAKVIQVFIFMFVVLSVMNICISFYAKNVNQEMREALETQAQSKQFGLQLADASDFLTQQAQAYVQYGEKKYYDAYWNEINTAKNREKAIEGLRALGAPPNELDLVAKAGELSNTLAQLEGQAFEEVASGNLTKARELMFGDLYEQGKQPIIETMNAFHEALNTRVQNEVARAQKRAAVCEILALISAVCLAVFGIAGLLIILRKIAPIRSLAAMVSEVARGNIGINMDRSRLSKDEIGELTHDIYSLVEVLGLLTGSMQQLKKWAVEGRILERVKEDERIKGTYRDILQGVNGIMDVFVNHYHAMPVGASIVNTSNYSVFANKAAEKHLAVDQENLQIQKQALTDDSGRTVGTLIVTVDQTNVMQAQKETEHQAQAVAASMKLAEKQSDYQKNGINAMIESIRQLARGDLNLSVHDMSFDEDTKELRDMFFSLEKSLVDSSTNIKSYIDELSEILEEIAHKNLNVGIQREYMGDFSSLKTSINTIAESLNEVFGEVAGATCQVQNSSQLVANSSQTLAQGASEQAGAVEEISSTIAQVASQTRNNAANANKANEISLGAKSDAETGNQQMDEMVSAMEAIKEASTGIAGIIKAIEDIAFQTNILALNAAVEAARAGEHGKGFAVVAEEVRTLAARSAAAAKETTEMIDNSLNKVEAGSKIAGDTAQALSKIVAGVTDTVNIVATIAQASVKQAAAIEQIDSGVEQISKVTQSNTATAEESASASEQLASQSQVLQQIIGEFKLKGKPPASDLTGAKRRTQGLAQDSSVMQGAVRSLQPPAVSQPLSSQKQAAYEDDIFDGAFGKY